MKKITTFITTLVLAANLAAETHVMNQQEFELFGVIVQSKYQKRPIQTLNPLLCKIARLKAEGMAAKTYFSHVSPQKIGPNQHLDNYGYELPEYFLRGEANSVESIFAGTASYKEPQFVVDNWAKSPTHRVHIFGETPFHASTTQIGVGSSVSKLGKTYFVFYSAPPNLKNTKPPTLVLPNKIPPVSIFGLSPQLDKGFRLSPWFGKVNDSSYPFVLHKEHGWLFVRAKKEADFSLYDKNLGWLNSNILTYPNFSRENGGNYKLKGGKFVKQK